MRKSQPPQYRQIILGDGTRLYARADNKEYGSPQDTSGFGGGGTPEMFRPARHGKPEKQGFLRSFLKRVLSVFVEPHPDDTTEIGSAGSASPSMAALANYSERYERREKIQDCRQMVFDEPRARRSTQKFAREAVRKGVVISVSKEKNKGVSAKQIAQAQEICDDIQKAVNPKLLSWAWMLIVEGDLFVQAVLSDSENKVVDAQRMPASAMERLTDDSDNFIDKNKAFAQIDVTTNETVAHFNYAVMHHARWNHIDGERYGESEIIAGRRLRKLIELMEEAQSVRRMTRATNRTLWKIMGAEGTPGTPQEVEDFKEKNGFLSGNREIFDPQEIARDFFTNTSSDMTNMPADTSVSDIADLKYFQNLYVSAVLPTPSALFNLDAESVNRDVLEDLRAEWLKETSTLSEMIVDVVRWLVNLGLLLIGIVPGRVEFDVHTSESSIEKPSEVIQRALDLRKNMTGDFQPDPIITLRKAIQLVSEHIDIDDVDAFLEELEAEKAADAQKKLEQQVQQSQLQAAAQGPEGQPGGEPGGEQGDAQPAEAQAGAPDAAPAAPNPDDVMSQEDSWEQHPVTTAKPVNLTSKAAKFARNGSSKG